MALKDNKLKVKGASLKGGGKPQLKREGQWKGE